MRDHRALGRRVDPRPLAPPDGRDDKSLSVRAHFELGLAVDIEKVEDRLLDNDAEAVADGRELLAHEFRLF